MNSTMTHKSHVTQTQPTVFRRMNVALNGNGFLYIKWRKKDCGGNDVEIQSNVKMSCICWCIAL